MLDILKFAILRTRTQGVCSIRILQTGKPKRVSRRRRILLSQSLGKILKLLANCLFQKILEMEIVVN
jgi:hypothetical protein